MQLLIETKKQIKKLGYSKSAGTIAHAAASACSQDFGVSLLRIDVGLDYSNKQLITRLLNITKEPDFNNVSQSLMLDWLENEGWLNKTPKVNH